MYLYLSSSVRQGRSYPLEKHRVYEALITRSMIIVSHAFVIYVCIRRARRRRKESSRFKFLILRFRKKEKLIRRLSRLEFPRTIRVMFEEEASSEGKIVAT